MRVNRADMDLIVAIAKRAVQMAAKYDQKWKQSDAVMDLIAAHNDCGLRLTELLNVDDGNFAHDVFGINRHLNHKTLMLEDCFLPRYAAPSTVHP